jgi:cytochrome P450
VLGDLLGIDESEHPTLIRWTDEIADFLGAMPPTVELARLAQTAMSEAATLFRELITQRRASPREDLLSRLVAGNPGAPLSSEELALQCTLLMFAGHETTRSLAGNALLALLRHPGELEILRKEPALIRSAVEEAARYESPVRFVGRGVPSDMDFEGHPLHAGQMILTCLGAANRDHRMFPEPGRFNIRRLDNAHLAFGAGQHACIGANVGRAEVQGALQELLRAFPKLELHAEPQWLPNAIFRGLASLPVG